MKSESRNVMKRILVLMLSLLMVIMCACKEDGTTSKGDSYEVTSSVSDNSNSSSNAESGSESGGSSSLQNGTSADLTKGDYAVESDLQSVRADINENFPPENCAQLLDNLTGYAEKEAEALRQEILNTGNTQEYYDIKGTIYYVSPSGSDNNDGLSPETPIRTTGRIVTLPLEEGDAVLFERNSIFRQVNQITCGKNNITYGSYGEGRKPMIYASAKEYANPSLWQPTKKKNVWVTESGYVKIFSMVFNFGEEIGYFKQNGLDQLQKNTDFYCNEIDGLTYLYFDKGNPGKYFSNIELCQGIYNFCVNKHVNGVTIDNICIKYGTLGAMNALYNNKNITVTNCEIGFSGGCTTSTGNRMGGPIGSWACNENFNVSHNWIYQAFDTAISPQGLYGSTYTNNVFCDNLLEYNNADFEWFDAKGGRWLGLKCDGNIMRFTSLGWGTRLDDAGIRGIEGCIRAETKEQIVKDFSFKNNIIDCPGKEIINWVSDNPSLEEYDIGNNTIYVKGSYREIFNDTQRVAMRGFFSEPMNEKVYINNQAELEAVWKTWDKSSTSKIFWYD